MAYSIIIPVYNEYNTLKTLLKNLKRYYKLGHEIIIIDDGSTDQSKLVLKKCSFINLLVLDKNHGKGIAIRTGLEKSKNEKIIIYDGDLELHSDGIFDLMILNRKKNIFSIMGTRFKSLNPIRSSFDWGNFIFTVFFNFLNKSAHKDILCCAKSFYKKDIPLNKLKSLGFDIDIELSSFLTKNNRAAGIKQVLIPYKRRSINQGKKLKIIDGWLILKRIILM